MAAITFIQQLVSTINEESFSLDHMIVNYDNYTTEDEPNDPNNPNNNQLNEFDNYVNLIKEIKVLSEKSKISVDNILQDNDKLKFLNTRLNDYGDLMKRLERLTSAVDELEYKIAVKEFDFRTIDNILDIIDNELSETQTFHGTSEFIALQERVVLTKSALKKEIFKRYREIGIWSEIPVTAYGKQIDSNSRASVVIESLRNANLIIDTLGEDTVTDLIETLIQSQILSYQIKGGYEGGELYSLEKESLEKRWEELYRLLGASSSPHMTRLMSSEWDITFKLYVEFCRRTAMHLEKLLDNEVKKLSPPVIAPPTPTSTSSSALLASTLAIPSLPSPSLTSFRSNTSLNDTTQEPSSSSTDAQQLPPSIPQSVVANTSTSSTSSTEIDPSLLQEHGNFVVQILKSILATENEVHKMFDDGVFALSVTGYVTAPSTQQQQSSSTNRCYLMSSMFDKYLDPFVQSERRNVQELIQSLVAEDIRLITPESSSTNPDNTTTTTNQSNKSSNNNNSNNTAQQQQSTKEEVVDMIAYTSSCQRIFNSAEMIFQTIRSSLLRCASFSSGLPLLTLAHEYKVCFQIYAETLRNCLCPSIPSTAQRVGKRQAFNLSLDEEILACRTVITAEKCASLIPQIQIEITSKLKAEYANDINMTAQSELFEDVTYHGVNTLVGSLLGKANECLVYMVATPWSKITVVGDCSPYIRKLHSMLTTVIPRLRKVLSWKCFEALCYRFSSDLLDYFLALIMGLKKISVVGAEQLLLDTNELKPLLMKLHHTALPQKSLERSSMQITEKYTEIVGKKSRLIEVVLKLICSDDDQIEDTFYIMWPEGQEGDLRTIKALKASTHSTSTTNNAAGNANGKEGSSHRDHHDGDGISSHDTSLPTSSGSGFGVSMLGSLGSLDSAVGNLRGKVTNLSDRFKIGKK